MTIDCESRCVWSKHTFQCHVRQDLADTTAKPTLHVNAHKFLDTVLPIPALFPDVETRESQYDQADETALTQLVMVPEFEFKSSLAQDLALDAPQIECSPVRTSIPNAINVGIQCDESSVVTMLADPLASKECPCCIRSGMLPADEFPSLVQFMLNPWAPSFLSTFEPSPASIVRSRNHSLGIPAVACSDECESSPMESCPVEHPTSLLSPMEDHDEDVTLFKSHCDPGGPELPVQVGEPSVERTDPTSTADDLPEHIMQLFFDTFEQTDFLVEATNGLKQLLTDHRHTFATSPADIGFCSILQHDTHW